MNFYRSPDAASAGDEPSYAKLAARLRKLPTYQHENSQALLDKLERGEIDSEECLHELTQDVIQRTKQQQEDNRQRTEHDTQQQQQLTQRREETDAQMARNATADEPVVVSADSSAPAAPTASSPTTATPPAAPASTSNSGGGGLAQLPPDPATRDQTAQPGAPTPGSDGGFFSMSADAGPGLDDDDERDNDFEN